MVKAVHEHFSALGLGRFRLSVDELLWSCQLIITSSETALKSYILFGSRQREFCGVGMAYDRDHSIIFSDPNPCVI